MQHLEVGKPLEKLKGREGMFFDTDSGGFILAFNFWDPSPPEIEQIEVSKPFEIRASVIHGDSLIITVKAGDLNWADAPFAPQIANLEGLTEPEEENEGIALTVIMSDARDGCVKYLRLIGLGHEFSVSLLSEIRRINNLPFDRQEHQRKLEDIFRTYTSREIAYRSFCRYKIEGN